MPDRNLLEVIHFMCVRIAAMSQMMADRRGLIYGIKVIHELANAMTFMPLTAEEVRYLHQELDPLIAMYGKHRPDGNLEHHWIVPVLQLVEKFPRGPLMTPSRSTACDMCGHVLVNLICPNCGNTSTWL